jgi:UDP-N-acetyl-2-amino-2-deoxyglucuronate dehydrogenase
MSIDTVYQIRQAKPIGLVGDYHPFANKPIQYHPFQKGN